jgi:hypothetical protein
LGPVPGVRDDEIPSEDVGIRQRLLSLFPCNRASRVVSKLDLNCDRASIKVFGYKVDAVV